MLTREQSTARRVIVFGLPAQVLPYVSYPKSLLLPKNKACTVGSLGREGFSKGLD
jgi:hypothetical protein